MTRRTAILQVTKAALVILGAAICAGAQDNNGAIKQNTREPITKAATTSSLPAEDVSYTYEFKKSDFTVRRIVIQHNANGKGSVSFERQGDIEAIVEPLELSESSRERIKSFWDALRFLESNTNYQSQRQYPHLGTMWLRMARGTIQRVAEFNWTNDPNAKALIDEYRHVANQAIFIFDIGVARQNQPLNSPKLLDQLERFIATSQLSDPKQLIPLLRDLSTDERLPLMARNKVGRILKRLEK